MPSQPNYQSVRSSCDRCHSQKLKCTISLKASDEETRQCERCSRAKLECIFSRRGRTRRQKDVDTRNSAKIAHSEPMGSTLTPPVSVLTSEHEVCDSPLWSIGMCNGEDSIFGGLGNHDLHVLDAYGSASGTAMDGMDELDEMELPPIFGNTNLFDVTPPSAALADMLPYSASSLAPYTSSSTTADSERLLTNAATLPDTEKRHPVVQRLSRLVSEIHDTLDTLRGGPWQACNSSSDLNDYPVGRVLALVREFEMVLLALQPAHIDPEFMARGEQATASSAIKKSKNPILPSPLATSLQEPPLTPCTRCGCRQYWLPPPSPLNDERKETAGGGRTVTDMPTVLLALTCYLQLVELFVLVFAQFENYLGHACQTRFIRQLPVMDSVRGPCLQLGELPSAHETCGKVYMAVQLLLDALRPIEDMVGLPNSLRTASLAAVDGEGSTHEEVERRGSLLHLELAHSVFNHNTICGENPEIIDLSKRVQSLKAMLREKMNVPL